MTTSGSSLPDLRCRRCVSKFLILLEKKRPDDNDVYRCQGCGYLFSPPEEPEASDPGAPEPKG